LGGQDKPPDFEYLDLVENYLRSLCTDLRIPVIVCTGRSRAFVEGICSARFAGCFSGFVFENGCVAVPKPDASLKNLVDLAENQRSVQLVAFVERLLHDWGVQFERCKEYLLTFKAEDLGEHREFIFSLLKNPDLTLCPPLDEQKREGRYDVMPCGISKLTGVTVLLNEGEPRNRLDIANLLHIGDDSNDAELLSKAGWKGLVPVRRGERLQLSPALQKIWEENSDKSTVFRAKEPVARGAYEILVRAFGSFFLK
jgi:hydroxymethylpyrimidine pyrophosphatase-like HAD family hydrolase